MTPKNTMLGSCMNKSHVECSTHTLKNFPCTNNHIIHYPSQSLHLNNALHSGMSNSPLKNKQTSICTVCNWILTQISNMTLCKFICPMMDVIKPTVWSLVFTINSSNSCLQKSRVLFYQTASTRYFQLSSSIVNATISVLVLSIL